MMNESNIYQAIADTLYVYIQQDRWDKAYAKIEIYGSMIRADEGFICGDTIFDEYREIPINLRVARIDAVLFLRNEILKNTGNRIWGLLFTLYPDGRFEVEYDYNKPEGYEETDDLITGDEINQSLGNLSS